MSYYIYPNKYSMGNNYNYNNMDCIIESAGGIGGLWIGNYVAASDTEILLRNGVRAVVTAASEAVLSYDSQVIPYHIKIPAMDYEGFLLDPYFDQVTDFIETHLRVTNVLVHCMAGISRSVSFVIAYLMKFRGMKYDEALGFIRSRRSVANPNSGFVTQLKRYRKYLKSHGKISKNQNRRPIQRQYQNPLQTSRLRSPNPLVYNPEETRRASSILNQDYVNKAYITTANNRGLTTPQSVDFYGQPVSLSDIRQSSNSSFQQNMNSVWNSGLTGYNYIAH